MRIGIDSRLPYYQGGGISKYIQLLIRYLAKIDEENDYIVFHQRKDSRSYLPSGAANFQGAALWTPCHHIIERWALGTELVHRKLDILHSPDFIPPSFGAKRKVITVHDLNFVHYPEFLTAESRRYYQDQILWAVNEADHISADSNHTRRDLINLLGVPKEKVTTVYLAPDPIFAEQPSAESIKTTLKLFRITAGYILFVGTISPRKNLMNLIAVYEQLLSERSIDIPLIIVGARGWMYEAIFDKVAALKLEQHVYHIDSADDYQLAHLYSAASMLVLPSFYEGFGFPILEAMHSGCPVIASDRGSLPEITGEAGILLDPEDLDAWFQAILDLLSNSDKRRHLIEAGYQQASRFAWDETARQTLAIYESLR